LIHWGIELDEVVLLIESLEGELVYADRVEWGI
jgi:hypothetical protein